MSAVFIPVEEKLKRFSVTESGCWEWTGTIEKDGYGVLSNGQKKQLRAHRASYEAAYGPVSKSLFVCHRCDNRKCINPEHLFVGTPADNTADMIKKGRKYSPKGEDHPNTKLSDSEVVEIIKKRNSGLTLSEIAAEFGVTFQHISAITLRKTRVSA